MSGSAAGMVTGATVTTTLAVVEAATGISVPMFVWGAVGGLWAFWYLEPMRLRQRLLSLLIAALVAGVVAKPVALMLGAAGQHYLAWWPAAVDAPLMAVPIALIIGLLCHTVIGKKLIEIASRTADGVGK